MDNYSELKRIIEVEEANVDFAEFGNGVSDKWIEKAEIRLGFCLPDSYKWWLKNYGGGEVYGEEIYSIYEEDFDTVVGGDIVYMYELNKKQNNFEDNMMVVCETDNNVFYFDISDKKKQNNEYPIYSLYEKKLYAQNFIEFLKKRIIGE